MKIAPKPDMLTIIPTKENFLFNKFLPVKTISNMGFDSLLTERMNMYIKKNELFLLRGDVQTQFNNGKINKNDYLEKIKTIFEMIKNIDNRIEEISKETEKIMKNNQTNKLKNKKKENIINLTNQKVEKKRKYEIIDLSNDAPVISKPVTKKQKLNIKLNHTLIELITNYLPNVLKYRVIDKRFNQIIISKTKKLTININSKSNLERILQTFNPEKLIFKQWIPHCENILFMHKVKEVEAAINDENIIKFVRTKTKIVLKNDFNYMLMLCDQIIKNWEKKSVEIFKYIDFEALKNYIYEANLEEDVLVKDYLLFFCKKNCLKYILNDEKKNKEALSKAIKSNDYLKILLINGIGTNFENSEVKNVSYFVNLLKKEKYMIASKFLKFFYTRDEIENNFEFKQYFLNEINKENINFINFLLNNDLYINYFIRNEKEAILFINRQYENKETISNSALEQFATDNDEFIISLKETKKTKEYYNYLINQAGFLNLTENKYFIEYFKEKLQTEEFSKVKNFFNGFNLKKFIKNEEIIKLFKESIKNNNRKLIDWICELDLKFK